MGGSIDATESLAIDFSLCPSEHLIWAVQNLGGSLFGRPRTGNEDAMGSTRFWRVSGLSFERVAVGSWIAVGAAEEVVST